MKTKEEILKEHVSLYFSSHHDKSRWNGEGEHGGAEWHTDKAIAHDIYKAMDDWGRRFGNWIQGCNYAPATEEGKWQNQIPGENDMITTEGLYQMFENQNK